jgi:hypothetical protein
MSGYELWALWYVAALCMWALSFVVMNRRQR